MKYVHIIVNTAYTAPFIKFINMNFDPETHSFFVIRGWSESKVKVPQSDNVFSISSGKDIKNSVLLILKLLSSKKIFIHGIFSKLLLLVLASQPRLLRKASWIIWGADLHRYNAPKITYEEKIEEFLRRICISKFSEIITPIEGDYQLAKEWYKVTAQYKYAIYPTPINSTAIDDILKSSRKSAYNDVVSIQIGNSATRENDHFELIDILAQYREQNVRIFALLSYGDSEYAKEVIEYGRSIFGDKFVGITEYMEYKDFVLFMNKMDLVIFNHKRQQAFGNILLALYLKKKVFISTYSTLWELLNHTFKLRINDVQSIYKKKFEEFRIQDDVERNANKRQIERIISEEYVAGLWNSLFDK